MNDTITQDVGERLKAQRKRYGLSQRQLAEKVEMEKRPKRSFGNKTYELRKDHIQK